MKEIYHIPHAERVKKHSSSVTHQHVCLKRKELAGDIVTLMQSRLLLEGREWGGGGGSIRGTRTSNDTTMIMRVLIYEKISNLLRV